MNKHIVMLAAALVFAAPNLAQAASLFDDLGGQPGIDRIVDVSVDNYLRDDRIKAIFEESNMERVREQLKVQFCQISDGPCTYTGHNMTETHKGLHLTTAHFNALVEDLQAAMETCNIPFTVQNRLLSRLAVMMHQVVTK